MIKYLQKKFIRTAMIAVTLLIVLMLGAINCGNIILMNRQMDDDLNVIMDIEGNPDNRSMHQEGKFSGHEEKQRNPKPHRNKEMDKIRSSVYFVVKFDGQNNINYINIEHTNYSDDTEARKLAESVLTEEDFKGHYNLYKYFVRYSKKDDGKTIVFLDTKSQLLGCMRVIFLSLGIGIVCWGLMLLLVINLSKRTINPIAENIELQKQFVTNAGHEIKTPLAIIQSNTEAMELFNGENKWSRNIKEQIVRLDGLMSNLLAMSKFTENSHNIILEEVKLDDLVKKFDASFAESFALRKIKFESNIEENVVKELNENQIRQLLSILYDNAVKYTNEGGNVWVRLYTSGKHAIFEIKNSCEDVSSIECDKIFNRFYRADAARTQKNGGYGIGLSFAKSIVTANGGTISAKCEKDNFIIFSIKF